MSFCFAVPLERPEPPPDYDPAGAVIRQLEASLKDSPSGGGSSKGSDTVDDSGARWKLWGRGKRSKPSND